MSDPYLVLGIPYNADDAAIHSAYLTAVKLNPPERDLSRFEAVRNAYEAIRDRRTRIKYELFNSAPPTTIDILDKAYPVQAGVRPSMAMFTALLRGER